MSRADYVIVGSGLTGAVIARTLHDAGCDVLVVESRTHVGGNVHDHIHAPTGIRVHTYGPHYFRTSSEVIWQWVNRFDSFYKYEAAVKSEVVGRLEGWPVTAEYVARECGENWKPSFVGTPANFEEASLAMMPREIYERFVRGYTQKQWGVDPRTLSASLAKRFDVRADGDPRLMQHTHQGIPTGGYTQFMQNLLIGIPVTLGANYLENRERWQARKLLVYTGSLDAYFDYDMGRLPYRGQRREHVQLAGPYAQADGQVNYPGPHRPEIRSLEWCHMLSPWERQKQLWTGSVVTYETPYTPTSPNDYEYPFPSDEAAALATAYTKRAAAIKGLVVCGRLGNYKYLDMDQAIGRAMMLAQRILEAGSAADRAA